MSPKQQEKRFLDFLEGSLSEQERAEFEQALESDPSLKRSFVQYQKILKLESLVAKERYSLDERFTEKVMTELSKREPGIFRRLFMKFTRPSRPFLVGVSSFAVLLLTLVVVFENQEQLETTLLSDQVSGGTTSLAQKYRDTEIALQESNSIDQEPPQNTPESKSVLRSIIGAIDSSAPRNKPAPIKPELTSDRAESPSGDPLEKDFSQSLDSSSIILEEPLPQPRKEAPLSARQSAVSENLRGGMPFTAPGVKRATPEITRERYEGHHENQPVLVSAQPVSTFSIDVDTGSYTNSRRFLSQGVRPPAEAIRIEEFINYFDYSYPAPRDEPFGLTYEIAPNPFDQERFILRLGIQARENIEQEKPWNLVFLIDVSGSMNDTDKLPLVKQALTLLVKNMRVNDRISIVTYAGHSGVALSPTSGTEKAKAISVIQSLGAGGSTHGSAGIETAYQLAKESFIKDGVNRVILTTDGDFNVGKVDKDSLIRFIEQKRESGIALTTIGVGTGNYNESIMEQLANKGNGNYFYLDSFREARKVFQRELAGTIETVAQDVKLQVEFNPQNVKQYRLIGYENRKLQNEDFSNDRVDAGEIGAGHMVTALYELVLADTEAARQLDSELRYQIRESAPQAQQALTNELGFLKIRYKEPQGNRSQLLSFPLSKGEVKSSISQASADFKFVNAVSAFAHKLQGSLYAPSASFADIREVAEAGISDNDPEGLRRELIELIRNQAAIEQ